MPPKSIITALTDCTIKDQSNNVNTNKDSYPTYSLPSITTYGYDSSQALHDVRDVNHENSTNKNKSKVNNNKRFKPLQGQDILTSQENMLPSTTNQTTISYTSEVWKYAIRLPNSNYSTCCLCPDHKKISTNNGSTSTLRKHLISKHQIDQLSLQNGKRKRPISSININRKKELHQLFINCIIHDGRTFNDLQKPGMKKLIQELIPGT